MSSGAVIAFSDRKLITVIPAAVAATIAATVIAGTAAVIAATATVDAARRWRISAAGWRRRRRNIDLAAAAGVIAASVIAAAVIAAPIPDRTIAAGVRTECLGAGR